MSSERDGANSRGKSIRAIKHSSTVVFSVESRVLRDLERKGDVYFLLILFVSEFSSLDCSNCLHVGESKRSVG